MIMNRTVIERLVIEHGEASESEVQYISDDNLAILASIVHQNAQAGRTHSDASKLFITLLVITAVLWFVQPYVDSILRSLVDNSGLLGLASIVLLPCFILFIVVPTFHK